MKCYYCHHRNGTCFFNADRTVVILCESCANRRLTMHFLSLKFNKSNTPYSQHPKNKEQADGVNLIR